MASVAGALRPLQPTNAVSLAELLAYTCYYSRSAALRRAKRVR
jgi:hypothetical protein